MGFLGRYRLPLAICLAVLALRLPVIGAVGLGDSEAYYWTWSKHLDLSYFDHPPAVAYVIRAGTLLFGDTAFGTRIVPTVLATATLFVVYLAGEAVAGAAAGLLSMGVLLSMPLFIVGGVAAAPDSPQVLFVALFVLFYVKARRLSAISHQPSAASASHPSSIIQHPASSSHVRHRSAVASRLAPHAFVVLAGLALGSAFLSKYSAVMLIPGLLAALALPQNRHWLRAPAFFIGVALCALCSVPVIVWNSAHDWGTLTYHFVSRQGNAGFSLANLGKLVGGQLAYFSPFVVAGFVWAIRRTIHPSSFILHPSKSDPQLLLDLVLIGLPAVLFFYLVILVTPNAEPHWPLAGYIPLAVVLGAALAARIDGGPETGDGEDRTGDRRPETDHGATAGPPTAFFGLPLFSFGHRSPVVGRLIVASLAFSLLLVVVAHVHILTPAIVKNLPASHNPKHDLTNELYGWDTLGARLEKTMSGFDGNRPFLLGHHYTFCSQLMFATGGKMETRCLNTRKDQFDFFPGAAGPFEGRDAIYVRDNRYKKAPEDLYNFARCDPGEKTEISRGGRKVREFETFLCRGFRGNR